MAYLCSVLPSLNNALLTHVVSDFDKFKRKIRQHRNLTALSFSARQAVTHPS